MLQYLGDNVQQYPIRLRLECMIFFLPIPAVIEFLTLQMEPHATKFATSMGGKARHNYTVN